MPRCLSAFESWYGRATRMQIVLSPPGLRDASLASLPDAALLASVRHLGARFPDARLREVAVVRARELDTRADPSGSTRVWLALESLQITGSFKVRGALVAIAAIRDAAARAGKAPPLVVAVSAGNHGAGVAYAAHALGIKAVVVVPSGTPQVKRDRIAAFGAEVRLGPTPHYDDAETTAIALAEREGAYFLSPYDDLDVIAGNGASLAFEITRALGAVPRAVLVPLGGGGLATGVACALAEGAGETLGSQAARRVWGAQSEASPAMARSLVTGVAIERLPATGPTLAEGLEGGILARAFTRAALAVAGVAVVSEASIGEAMAYAFRELGLVIEGSSACALAPILAGLPAPMRANGGDAANGGGGDLVAVLTGRNVDGDVIARVRTPAQVLPASVA